MQREPILSSLHSKQSFIPFLLGIGLFCVFVLWSISSFGEYFYRVFDIRTYLVLHHSLEFFSIVTSFALSTVGWYSFRQNKNKQILMIGLTFFTVGLFDFLHLLSFPGMPTFITPSSTEKAIYFWMAARITGSTYLLISAFIHPKSRNEFINPPVVGTAAFLVVLGISAAIISYGNQLPQMFIEGKGLTPLKIALEYLVILLTVAAMLSYGFKKTLDPRSIFFLEIALLFSAFSELSFTLYISTYDTYNLVGHIFKILGFYFIFQALFIPPLFRPYEELRKAKAEITEESKLRKKLEDLNRKLQLLNTLGEKIIANPDMKIRLDLICENAAELLHGNSCVIAIRDEMRDRMIYPHSYNMPTHISKISVPLDEAICAQIMKTRQSVLLVDYPRHPLSIKEFVDLGIKSMVASPLIAKNKAIGVLMVFSSDQEKAFTEQDIILLESLANQAALAIDGARLYEQQRYIAQTLQASFLPRDLALRPELDVGFGYISATRAAMIGGDFYDLFDLPHNLLGLFIGDVAGRGIETAAFTSIAKNSLLAFALENSSPSSVLTRTNRAISKQHNLPFIALFYGVINPASGELRYGNAGHMPPLIYRKLNKHTSFLRAGDIPLGVEDNYQFLEYSTILNEGDRIIIFTDGLPDLRRDKETFGEERVIESTIKLSSFSPQALASELIAEAQEFAHGSLNDDIAIMVIEMRDKRTSKKAQPF